MIFVGAALHFVVWMLPWIGLALVAIYAGYLAYQASQAREEAAHAPRVARPDPVEELERINTELAKLAVQTRKSLENAKDAMSKGLKG